MNKPTEDLIFNFVKNMPLLGEGGAVCEIGENPYSIFHPAHDTFEHDRKNWNVLGLVRIEEALQLNKWSKLEAVLWAVGLCLPGSVRHDQELGQFKFDEESKRRFLIWMERFLRNSASEEASPSEWIAHAKAQGGQWLAALTMHENQAFKALWDEPVIEAAPTEVAQQDDAKPHIKYLAELKKENPAATMNAIFTLCKEKISDTNSPFELTDNELQLKGTKKTIGAKTREAWFTDANRYNESAPS